MSQASAATTTEQRAVADRARTRTLTHRRRRIVRSVAAFFGVSALMLLVAMAHRDTQALRADEGRAQRVAQAFQERFEAEGWPPLRLPQLGRADRGYENLFVFNVLYSDQVRVAPPVAVCCRRDRLRLFVRGEVRFVVMFDGQRYGSQWLSDREFFERADRLGLAAARPRR